MDFRSIADETAGVIIFSVNSLSMRLPSQLRRLCRPTIGLGLLALSTSACDRIKGTLKGSLETGQSDPAWQGDSALIASRPSVLYRVVREGSGGARAIPIATMGERGFRPLALSNRGWRAFDLTFLQAGAPLAPYRANDPLPPVASTRGMWEGAPLDTIDRCNVILPAALVSVPDGVELMTSGERPLRPAPIGMSDGAVQQALEKIPTLIAPTSGVPLSLISRYRRQVYIGATGASDVPTIVVTYDDPEVVPDSVPAYPTPRPRQFIVVMDKGLYGYKPSYTFTTLGNSQTPPRRKFLGFLDADGDGKSELFFGIQNPKFPLVTYALRFRADAWVESFKYERQRCQG